MQNKQAGEPKLYTPEEVRQIVYNAFSWNYWENLGGSTEQDKQEELDLFFESNKLKGLTQQ